MGETHGGYLPAMSPVSGFRRRLTSALLDHSFGSTTRNAPPTFSNPEEVRFPTSSSGVPKKLGSGPAQPV
jgi:hypothetical protein